MKLSPIRTAAAVAALALIAAGVTVARQGFEDQCRPTDGSVATIWNAAALDAIRRDFPAPTVHSRNLYHLSAAMWDTWAAFDTTASGLFVDEIQSVEDVGAARQEAISFAAHRLLTERYQNSTGAEQSLAQFDDTLASLCFDPAAEDERDGPATFGVRVADAILSEARSDGSLEASGYVDLSYASVNPPLVVDESGTEMVDPNRWQPLSLSERVTQNGQRLDAATQEFIGPNWGFVIPFAIEPDPQRGLPFDPGPPPLLGSDDEGFVAGASEVVRLSSRLDPLSDTTIDISPAALGDVVLGTYDAEGRPENPITGTPYEPNVALEADYGRVIAEYWADGPDSETPPGHWNTLAIEVGDALEADDALTIDGVRVDRLEWDVKIGLALNGALHDTAIAVWGGKGSLRLRPSDLDDPLPRAARRARGDTWRHRDDHRRDLVAG